MAILLKQSTLVTVRLGPFLDATDGVTEEVALGAMGVEISKNHGAFAARNSATATVHDAEGWYSCELNATDTNTLGPLIVKAHAAATHLPVWQEYMVLPANVFDSLIAGSDALQVHANEITAGLITAAAIATGAIDADALAADAVAEIADGVWDELSTGHVDAGKAGEQLWTDLDAVLVDTAVIGAAGAGLTAVPWNAAWDAEVESEVIDALNTILADSIPADGTLPTVRQALYMLVQFMLERSVAGTTVTVKKADGSTTLFTLTLNDATTPSSITRAT